MSKMFLCVLILLSLTTFSQTSGAESGVSCRDCQIGTDISLDITCEETGECDSANSRRSRRLPRHSETPDGACVLPLHPDNGMYEVSNVPDAQPGQTFDYAVLTVSCRRGYGVVELTDIYEEINLRKVYCVNGEWSQSMPKCVRFCKLDPDPSIRYMCPVSRSSDFQTCDNYVAPGTSVRPICNSPIYYSSETLLPMNCIAGTWNYVAKCKEECGRLTGESKQLILDGEQGKRGELPWHVGIYQKTYLPFKQICGGSLIADRVVITAAHCFLNDVKKLLPATDFAVAIGKLSRPWHDKKDIYAQTSEVKEIKVSRLFEGEAANPQDDIAIVILTTPFVYKSYVRPVCLNFDANFNKWQLQQGKLGKVAGWGLSEADDKASQMLKVVEIPYVKAGICTNTLPPSEITDDKFCAGYNNGTALCKGDSGGGLAFADKELGIDRYYLRGIVSAPPRNESESCDDEAYTIFTKITKHEKFIKQSIAALVKKSCALNEFQCTDGACVDQRAECNGKQDCADASDESDYLCKPESISNLQPHSHLCTLPPHPKHGTYTVANLPTARPGQLVDSFTLTVSCDQGYGIADSDDGSNETSNQQVYCVNGEWYQIMPKCIRYCKVQPDPSVRFVTCQKPGSGSTTCQDYVPPKTTVIPSCNTPDYFSTETLPFMKCLNGSWNYVAKCQPAFCNLNPDPNTRYMCKEAEADEFRACDNRVRPGVTVKPICDTNITQVLQNMTCTLGTWNYVAKCKTDSCPSNADPSIKLMCQDPVTNEFKTCNDTVAVGTSVKPVCNSPYYYSTEVLKTMTCTDESWDYVATCQPECGKITRTKIEISKDKHEIDGNDEVEIQHEMTPWHVIIRDKDHIFYELYTVGTLVRDNVVLSGASRFYDTERGMINTFKQYVAEVTESGLLDHTKYLQKSDVKSINILSSYQGEPDYFLGDMSVLTLVTPFKFNVYVSPVCLDFDMDFDDQQLAVGNIGKMGYFGELYKNELTIIDTNTCINNLPDAIKPRINEDKICHTYGIEIGEALDGNYGAGVYFPRNESGVNRYYLRGVLQNGCYGLECDINFSWSLRITQYKEFIQQYLN